ncbi:hypothetical protein AKJ16_DCAP08794 [Drosera capensis]
MVFCGDDSYVRLMKFRRFICVYTIGKVGLQSEFKRCRFRKKRHQKSGGKKERKEQNKAAKKRENRTDTQNATTQNQQRQRCFSMRDEKQDLISDSFHISRLVFVRGR